MFWLIVAFVLFVGTSNGTRQRTPSSCIDQNTSPTIASIGFSFTIAQEWRECILSSIVPGDPIGAAAPERDECDGSELGAALILSLRSLQKVIRMREY